jgi:hypothetical protein
MWMKKRGERTKPWFLLKSYTYYYSWRRGNYHHVLNTYASIITVRDTYRDKTIYLTIGEANFNIVFL